MDISDIFIEATAISSDLALLILNLEHLSQKNKFTTRDLGNDVCYRAIKGASITAYSHTIISSLEYQTGSGGVYIDPSSVCHTSGC